MFRQQVKAVIEFAALSVNDQSESALMLILFHQATLVPLRTYLKEHIIRTAAQQGWDRLRNGDLLNAAEAAAFDVLITTDRNMRYQQSRHGRRIAVVILSRQPLPELELHVQLVIEQLTSIQPGSLIEVLIPPSQS